VQGIHATGTGNREFDPQQWLNEDQTQVTLNNEPGNMPFGAGLRRCPGSNLATTELLTILVILARKVQAIEMSEATQNEPFFLQGHPTGLPLRLVPR
jgi:cytochrome P450